MNKTELNERWGHICDTDKLVDRMMALLTKFYHRNTEHGVCKMLDEYFTNKIDMILLLQKSEHYVGDMRVVIDIELERDNSGREVKDFCRTFAAQVEAHKVIYKYVDENGKTVNDYMRDGTVKIKAKDLRKTSSREKLMAENLDRAKFAIAGHTNESGMTYSIFTDIVMYEFRKNYQSKVNSTLAREINNVPGLSIAEGMKTSRAFNKVCTHYGINTLPNYNKLFARYADMVSGLKRKMKFYISVNPLDYLTMSFGNSWASCHTIDKTNQREMPNSYRGEYCGGTVSYMLDATSIITYVHSSIPEDVVEEGKIYRNMFHYADGKLIQGRIYPQGNDGATDLYKVFRGFMQDELSKMLGLESNIWVKKNERCEYNTTTHGVHYPDYLYMDDCNVSYVREMPNASSTNVVIGSTRVCPYCGEYLADYEEGEEYREAANRLLCENCY